MLRLRISFNLWERARDSERLLVDLETYLNRHVQWVWRQPARYRADDGTWRLGAVRPVMLSMEKDADLKVVMRPGTAGADYTIVALRRADSKEKYETVSGRSLKGETFQVLRPTEHVDCVAVIVKNSYTELPTHLKTPIAYAWTRLVHGLEQQRVRLVEDGPRRTLFLLTGPVDQGAVQDLSDALANADAGTVTIDPYETRLAEELCKKYGEPSRAA